LETEKGTSILRGAFLLIFNTTGLLFPAIFQHFPLYKNIFQRDEYMTCTIHTCLKIDTALLQK